MGGREEGEGEIERRGSEGGEGRKKRKVEGGIHMC